MNQDTHSIYRVVVHSSLEERVVRLFDKNIFFIQGALDTGDVTLSITNFMTMQSDDMSRPKWIVMDSGGGDVIQGFGLYDAIMAARSAGHIINVLCVGFNASMATVVLQAATRRYSWPHTQFLVHQLSTMISEGQQVEANQQLEDALVSKRLTKISLDIISKRTGMPLLKLLHKSKKTDWWLSPEEALKFGPNGLIDEIITGYPF